MKLTDCDPKAIYICPACVKEKWKNFKFGILKNTNVFCQDGEPVTLSSVCSKCRKSKRCLRFSHAD